MIFFVWILTFIQYWITWSYFRQSCDLTQGLSWRSECFLGDDSNQSHRVYFASRYTNLSQSHSRDDQFLEFREMSELDMYTDLSQSHSYDNLGKCQNKTCAYEWVLVLVPPKSLGFFYIILYNIFTIFPKYVDYIPSQKQAWEKLHWWSF